MKKIILSIFLVLIIATFSFGGPWVSGGGGGGGGTGNVTLSNVTANAICTAKDTAGNINCTTSVPRTDIASVGHLIIVDGSGRFGDAAVSSPLVYSSGTLSITAGIPNGIIQWDTSKYPSGDGANITGVNADTVDGSHAAAFQAASANLTALAGNNGTALSYVTAIALSDAYIDWDAAANAANSIKNKPTLRTDTATASHIPYIDAGGNATNLTVGAGLTETGGTLTARQLASISFADTDAAVTVAVSKKGYVVPLAYNGANISTMTCAVYDLNAANANTTVINLTKSRAGNLTNVFDTGVNIANTDYTATSTGVNATNAALLTGDLLIPNVTAIADPAPKGLNCTFIFAL